MEKLRRLRTEKGLSQARLAARAELDPSTVNQIERGAREASSATLRKLADALDVGLIDLLEPEAPKAQAPLQLDYGAVGHHPMDASRLLTMVEDLEDLVTMRAERHERDVDEPDGPHFRTATAGALWVATAREEATMLADWSRDVFQRVAPKEPDELRRDFWTLAFKVGFMILGFHVVIDRGEARVREMRDKPDELATRRLEAATSAALPSRKELEEREEAASG